MKRRAGKHFFGITNESCQIFYEGAKRRPLYYLLIEVLLGKKYRNLNRD